MNKSFSCLKYADFGEICGQKIEKENNKKRTSIWVRIAIICLISGIVFLLVQNFQFAKTLIFMIVGTIIIAAWFLARWAAYSGVGNRYFLLLIVCMILAASLYMSMKKI